ncbi:MAG: response regulator transcription factor [Gaiellaceae bacterium]
MARILLVEDEDSVRPLLERILEQNGFDVLAARDGVDALEVLDRCSGGVDLLVTDVLMPRMHAPALAERLAARGDATPVLFMSGYTGGELRAGTRFLRKPFTTAERLSTVRELLPPFEG